MKLFGNYFAGDPFGVDLTPDMIDNKEFVAEIERRIRSMRPLLNEFVVINLKSGETDNIPEFFQTTRERSFSPEPQERYGFCVEIGIPGTDGERTGMWIYYKEGISCEEAVRLFYEICVERKEPDLREWGRSDHIFGKEETEEERSMKLKMEKCGEVFKRCINGEVRGPVRDALMSETLETLIRYSWFEYSQPYLSLCKNNSVDSEFYRTLEERTSDPVLAAAKADFIYEGKLGQPDLRAAYELYAHAARIGSLYAAFMTAKAFRDGWLGTPNIERFEEIVISIYDFYMQNDPSSIFALPEVVLELSRIEERRGSIDKAIEHCLEWKKMALSNADDDCYPTEKDGQIVRQLYRLTEFDPSDIDLLDLYYVLRSPCRVEIFLEHGIKIEVEAVRYEDEVIVKCGGNYFRTAADFFKNYRFNGERITAHIDEILYITMEKDQ